PPVGAQAFDHEGGATRKSGSRPLRHSGPLTRTNLASGTVLPGAVTDCDRNAMRPREARPAGQAARQCCAGAPSTTARCTSLLFTGARQRQQGAHRRAGDVARACGGAVGPRSGGDLARLARDTLVARFTAAPAARLAAALRSGGGVREIFPPCVRLTAVALRLVDHEAVKPFAGLASVGYREVFARARTPARFDDRGRRWVS